MARRQRAGRVCSGGISGQQQRLAAAAAEILRAPLAAAARLRHPAFSSEALECFRLLPDPAQLSGCNVVEAQDRKSTRLNSSHMSISYAVFCLKKKNGISHGFSMRACYPGVEKLEG